MMLFVENSYLKEFESKILNIENNNIVLEETVFYAKSGRQPGDTGKINLNDKEINIIDTIYDQNKIISHVCEDVSDLKIGDKIKGKINWQTRYKHMRMHSALHLLCSLIPYDVTGGQISYEKSRLDFYNFLVSGEIDKDDRLQDGDVIFVPIRYSSVEITGEVYRKQIFELFEGEGLRDIFTYCGGLKVNAQKMIEIHRIIPPGKREFEDFAREVFYKSAEDLDFNLIDGDKLLVKDIFNVNQTISVQGMVKSPDNYPFIPDMKQMDLLEKAGGIHDQSFIQKMDLNKVELVRRDPLQEYPIIYEIDVNSILNGDKEQNLLLKNWDVIFVRGNINFEPPESVKISGEVRSPGIYTLVRQIETLNDIINRAGGYTSRAFKKGIKVFRSEEQIILKDFNMPLFNGDKIMVPQHPSVIKVSGEVYNPGLVQYEKGKSIDYYIESAGGFNLNADQTKITVIYADGDVDIKKTFHNPKTMEGCHIVVQKAEEKEDFNFTEFLKETASILASMVTIIYIINSAG